MDLSDSTAVVTGGAGGIGRATGRTVERYPLGRLGTPEEVADAIAFLASDEASFVTGHGLALDGGFSAH